MNSAQLRELQTPLKDSYSVDPAQAIADLEASGTIDCSNLTCKVHTPAAADQSTLSGLHPKAGGSGLEACSGDMLLQSLVACSGVTFAAVSTAMELQITSAEILAKGQMDFRGTLGIDRNTPVGLTSIALGFKVESPEPSEKIDKLIQLTERYCVVLQTLSRGVEVTSHRMG